MVKPIAEKFRALYDRSDGRHGYVSIQGDPIEDEDAEAIVHDSIENRQLGPNICCKIPTTVGRHRGDGEADPAGHSVERH